MTLIAKNAPQHPGQQGRRPVIDRQVVLPLRRSVQIAFQSLRVRFLRSIITTLSLLLAVAFLSFVQVSHHLADSLLAQKDPILLQAVRSAGYDVAEDGSRLAESPKQRWIVFLSLLVCTVGIVNAQLMAVSERFREIGTMKCLGALDRFVLRLFLLEAGMQGAAGAALGALTGAGMALLLGLMRFGAVAWDRLEWGPVVVSILWATAIGFSLSLIGVAYPAVVASRMQPVEAMRVEP